MVRQAMEEVRCFSRALRPICLEDLGLRPALELLTQEAGAHYTMAGEQRRLEPTIELSLYRIAQESLNNARHHAQSQRIEVDLGLSPSSVTIAVNDDGIGFAPPPNLGSLSRDGHFGLMGIQERVALIGARLAVDTAPGKGATVAITIVAQAPRKSLLLYCTVVLFGLTQAGFAYAQPLSARISISRFEE